MPGGQKYDWEAIRQDYISDPTASYRKLAVKYGVSKGRLTDRAVEEGWFEQRKQLTSKAGAEFEEALVVESIGAARAIAAAREVLATRALAVASHTTDPDELHKLASTLQILSKMMGLQPDLDEKEQRARIASIEAKAQVQEEQEDAGTILIPAKEWETDDE